MLRSPLNTLRRLFRETRGTEIAEAAMVLPMLFMAIIGIFWFGQAFRIYGTGTHAAMEGARAAVAPACTTCVALTSAQIDTNAVTAVNNALTAAHLNPAQLKPAGSTWNPPTLCSCGSTSATCTGGAAVSCDNLAGTSNVCVQPNVQLSYATVSGGAGSCGTSVSFGYQYPVRFTLPCWPQPCTSLDLSKMTLTAQAQMRVETQ